MLLGIGTYTYSWGFGIPGYENGRASVTLEELLQRAHDKSCRVVQICDNAFLEKLSAAERQALVRQAEELDLVLEVGTRGIDPANLRVFLGLAKDMKAGLVRSMLPKEGYGTEIADAVAMLRDIMPEYEKAGVLLSLENHDRHKCHEQLEVLSRVGSANLGICLDTANSYGTGEDSDRVIEMLLPAANCLHIKEYSIARIGTQMGFLVAELPAGMGMLNIPKLLKRYASKGEKATVILELWTPYLNTLDETVELEYRWAEKSLEYLRPFFANDE